MPKRFAPWRGTLLTVAATAVALTVLGVLAFCAFGGTAATPPGRAPGTAVVVASFNFPESELLAAIYALALMQAGIPARLQLGLGPRELVQSALAQGLVDVVPEYLGTALTSLKPGADVAMSDPVAVRHELVRALARWHVQVLQPAAAQDQDGLVVTGATAARLRLRTVSDLGPTRAADGSRRRAGVRAAAVLPTRAAAGIRPGVRQVRTPGHRAGTHKCHRAGRSGRDGNGHYQRLPRRR